MTLMTQLGSGVCTQLQKATLHGRCSPPVRSTCTRSTAGRPSPPSPSISRLTSQLETIPSCYRRFQPLFRTAPGHANMRFDLTDLRLFLSVVESASITQGASNAHIAAASASERIRNMEHE